MLEKHARPAWRSTRVLLRRVTGDVSAIIDGAGEFEETQQPEHVGFAQLLGDL
jgi:hypothetical protein